MISVNSFCPILGHCHLKILSLFSPCIFSNIMSNYAWTLTISWKRKIFIYFIKCYWMKNLISFAIQKKKYLVVFHKHEIIYTYIYSCSYIYFLKVKLEQDLYLYNFVFANIFCIYFNLKLFMKEWNTCAWFCYFLLFFSSQHFWAWTSKLFLRVTKPKHVLKVH